MGCSAAPSRRIPNVWLLETNFPNLPPIGKNGAAFPINANVYRIVAIRMRTPADGQYMLFYWTTNTMHDPPGLQVSNVVTTTPGWRIYFVDLATLGLLSGSEAWNGTKRSLRLDPAQDHAAAGGQIEIDWVRLVDNQPALFRNVTLDGLRARSTFISTMIRTRETGRWAPSRLACQVGATR